jgi:hypothetical protein
VLQKIVEKLCPEEDEMHYVLEDELYENKVRAA